MDTAKPQAAWRIRTDKFGYGVPTAIEDSAGKAICQFTWTITRPMPPGQLKQRAKLLVSAPMLKYRLEQLVKAIRDGGCGDYSPLMDELLDAEAILREASSRD